MPLPLLLLIPGIFSALASGASTVLAAGTAGAAIGAASGAVGTAGAVTKAVTKGATATLRRLSRTGYS